MLNQCHLTRDLANQNFLVEIWLYSDVYKNDSVKYDGLSVKRICCPIFSKDNGENIMPLESHLYHGKMCHPELYRLGFLTVQTIFYLLALYMTNWTVGCCLIVKCATCSTFRPQQITKFWLSETSRTCIMRAFAIALAIRAYYAHHIRRMLTECYPDTRLTGALGIIEIKMHGLTARALLLCYSFLTINMLV